MSDNQSNYLFAADHMIEYCETIADEFLARYNRIRHFVTDHNLTSGTANEAILRNFLAEYSEGKYSVGQGFIYNPTVSNQSSSSSVSKQCDILVYDRDYPLVHSDGDVKIIWPQAVQFLIEVKSNLTKSSLVSPNGALENIRTAKMIANMSSTPGLIFAFRSSGAQTIINHLEACTDEFPAAYLPTAILLLDRGVVIHRWNKPETYTFDVRKCNSKATVIAFLLLFFFEKITDGKWGGSSFVNILSDMLQYRTTPFAQR